MELETKHIFERAGLGLYPYQYIGCEYGKSGCQYCGTAIAYKFYLKSKDQKTFYVGCDCINKSGDQGLVKLISKDIKKMQAEQRQARKLAKFTKIKALFSELYTDEIKAKFQRIPHPNDYFASLGKTMADYIHFYIERGNYAGAINQINNFK